MRARRVWLGMGVVAVLAAGAAAAAVLAWPQGAIGASGAGLADVRIPGFAGQVEAISAVDSSGKAVAVAVHDGTVWPREKLAPGARVTVTVTFRRPGWIGWLVGHDVEKTYSFVAPSVRLREEIVRPEKGGPVTVRFSSPVTRIAVGGGRVLRFPRGRKVVRLGIEARGSNMSGATTVAVAARPWEALSRPLHVWWFARGSKFDVVASPAPGKAIAPTAALTLTFAKPLGTRMPKLEPAGAGTWRTIGAHTLELRPARAGLPLGGTVRVRVPHHSFAWHVRPGSTLRLQEILARLGYLPVRWRGPKVTTAAGELDAAVAPSAGAFSWRYANTPQSLQALWKPGAFTVVTQGAVMQLEEAHGLATDGVAGPAVWNALLADDLANRRHTGGYNYVFVHETLPETMNLWHNGRVIQTSPGNTGIASAPTELGTWPVFEHITVGTMSGTNPDGSHYNDPGIRWISYFHGGDALHEFPRASYGTPQSLGCVELPEAAAAAVWPYTPIGTLVTIEP